MADAKIALRQARPEEQAFVAELLYGSPSAEAAGVAGGAEHATRLGSGLFLAGIGKTAEDDTLVALRDGRIVGALLAGCRGASFPVSRASFPKAASVVWSVCRLAELPGLLRRVRLRARLDFAIPPGSYPVVDLHVESSQRGAGIGAALLREAEALALRRACARINLSTAITNPARRLYERLGYAQVACRVSPAYEALTGTPGRVLLEKTL